MAEPLLIKRGRWRFVLTSCLDCGLNGEVRIDAWRRLGSNWRCASCAALRSHRENPQIRRSSRQAVLRHGDSRNSRQSGHWLYTRWQRMKRRVKYSPTYVEKGVIICEAWAQNFLKFKEWCLANGADQSLELDRINNQGNYEPANCRWITHAENCRNRGPRVRRQSAFPGGATLDANPSDTAPDRHG